MHTPTGKIAVLAVLFSLILAACGGGAPAQPTAAPSSAPQPTATESAFGNPTVPFEGVVQIWAMYYDENGDLQEGWTGSGTIVSPDGYILTNAHVVLPDRYFPVDELIVAMTVGQDQEPVPSYFAETLQADATLDLAVIRVTHDYDGNEVDYASLNLPFVPLGNSDDLNLGDALTILGYPGIGGETVTLTRGEVSGFTSEPAYGARAFIKTSATIAGGNSGGLAANANGELIGVPTQLGYGGDDQFVDCRVLADTNRDGFVDDFDSCIPTGGFINALRPVTLALPLLEAAQNGEVSIIGGEEPLAVVEPVASGGITDDFSDVNSGWDILSYESYFAYYQDGEYFIQHIGGGTYYYARPYLNFANVHMTVDLRFDLAEGINEIDLICRFVDNQNTYEFRVLNDGSVGIAKWLAGEYIPIADLVQTGADFSNGAVHTASITCDGSYLSLSLDGRIVAEAFDDSFVSGDLGLAAYNPNENTVLVAVFDNFDAVVLEESSADGVTVIYDEFNDETSGWIIDVSDETSRYYADGRYFMEVNPPQSTTGDYLLATEYTNVGIHVDVNIEQAAHDGDIGIICRLQDGDNYYALEVSEDGYYSIWKIVGGEFTWLIEWTQSPLVPVDSESFTLHGFCDGAQLTIGINGEILGTATDADLTSGFVGLIAGTYENGGLVVSFDNYEVVEYE